mmetsp:Transcript_45215/g.51956  ORF Transcript_45215/g.51956 Transcript_45215/m.51956 type:complete len:291 (+) Transcript_45215:1168-2040(+)
MKKSMCQPVVVRRGKLAALDWLPLPEMKPRRLLPTFASWRNLMTTMHMYPPEVVDLMPAASVAVVKRRPSKRVKDMIRSVDPEILRMLQVVEDLSQEEQLTPVSIIQMQQVSITRPLELVQVLALALGLGLVLELELDHEEEIDHIYKVEVLRIPMLQVLILVVMIPLPIEGTQEEDVKVLEVSKTLEAPCLIILALLPLTLIRKKKARIPLLTLMMMTMLSRSLGIRVVIKVAVSVINQGILEVLVMLGLAVELIKPPETKDGVVITAHPLTKAGEVITKAVNKIEPVS